MDSLKFRKHVGRRIRELRLSSNFTQEAVAEDLGIAHNTLSAWERGTRPISLDNLLIIASYFKVQVTDIVDFSDS